MFDIEVVSSLFVISILAIAAVTDIRERKIPNFLPIMLAVGFVILAAVRPEMREVAPFRLIGASLAFVFGLAFFSAGIFGGGDVKLLAALVLWHPADQIGALIIAIGIGGAIVSLFYTATQFSQSQRSANPDEVSTAINLRAALRTKIPYGVAILMGHLTVGLMPAF